MIPDPTPTPDDQTTPSADWGRALLERQVVMLGQLAEVGLGMALVLERQVKALDAPAPAAQPAFDPERAFIAYARVARAVRQSLMLQARLIKQIQAEDAQAASSAAFDASCARVERGQQTVARKAQVERIVERIAAREHGDTEVVERLIEETCERLDCEDLYGHVLDRPLSELVAMICHDLGLDPDWPRLAEEAWALEEVAGGVVGEPLAAGSLGRRPERSGDEGRKEDPRAFAAFVPPS
jgi:hypothetical protein